MLKFGLSLCLVLLSANVYAIEPSAIAREVPRETPRENRIKNDIVLKSILNGIEKKYQVKCNPSMDAPIEWRCLNGPQCGYKLNFNCSRTIGGDVIMEHSRVTVDGFDDGIKNDIMEIRISRVR